MAYNRGRSLMAKFLIPALREVIRLNLNSAVAK